MKPNEKKLDLLLDALSYIDDDVLTRGLSLRDAEETEKKPNPTDYLYDPSGSNRKPTGRKPLRVLLVAASMAVLLSVLPLSLWMIARRSEDPSAPGDTTADEAVTSDPSADTPPPIGDTDHAPGDGPEETREPMEEGTRRPTETEAEASTEAKDPEWIVDISPEPYTPTAWDWTIESAQNGDVSKFFTLNTSGLSSIPLQYCYTAKVDTNAAGDEDFSARPISPEDELVLDLYAQYCLSLYRFDYGSHYLLFHPAAVTDRFTNEVQPYGYEEALGRIRFLADLLLPYDGVSVDISLTENRLLAGEELADYLADVGDGMAEIGLSAEKITAVRRFSATGTVTVAGLYEAEDWGYDTEFYCYEYEDVWYMADRHMDDDISIDLAMSEIVIGRDYLKTRVHYGTVADIRDGYVYLEDGSIFTNEALIAETGTSTASVGDSVEIHYFDVGLLVKVSETEWASMSPSVRIIVTD